MTDQERIEDIEERVAELEERVESIEEASAEAIQQYDRETGS